MSMTRTSLVRALALAAIVPLGACDILDVESPGRITDENLNRDDAIPGIVTGMRYDLAEAMDNTVDFMALAGQELFHGGSYDWAEVPRGIWEPEDIGSEWSSPQQARWVAENGIERIREILTEEEFNRSGRVAEAYLYAGAANRVLGEMFCETVIDGGDRQPHEVHFERAMEDFQQALTTAQAAGRDDLTSVARAGIATMEAWMGNWGAAASAAAQVPTEVEFVAPVDVQLENEIAEETHLRFEYTVFNTMYEDHPDDSRVPWQVVFNADGSVANGANGSTPMFQQLKYDDVDDDYPLIKGTEMRLLEAEAALRSGDIGGAYAHMNELRAFQGLDPLSVASTAAEAWEELMYERSATLWLEGRRLWDVRRLSEDDVPNPFAQAFQGRQLCLPISQDELDANPNLRGG